MLTLTSLQLNAWLAGLLWPASRVLGLVASAPLFGSATVPPTVKLVLGLLLTVAIAPAVPAAAASDPASMAGLLIVAQQMLIGLAMGFSMRVVFAAFEMAGEVISLTMGLGFATFFDPQTRGQTSAVNQFLALLATMLFLAMNGHLALIEALAESFYTLPVTAAPMSMGMPAEVARWGTQIFSAGLQMALPVVAALLLTNVALGVLTRAAPQLNLFGIGFPITLGAGYLMIALALPYLGGPMQAILNGGMSQTRAVVRASLQRAAPAPPSALRSD